MQNVHFDYARAEVYRREAGLREAQRNGTAYEYRPRKRFSWPWRSSNEPRGIRHGGVIGAQ